MKVDTAIVRGVARSLDRCEVSFIDRVAIDVDRAVAEHAVYVDALVAAGVDLVCAIDADDEFPDGVFVEDCAVVFSDKALITRPGAPSRRGETRLIADAIAAHRPLIRMEDPATLDGGDVLVVNDRVFVGKSSRTNDQGVDVLRRVAGAVTVVDVKGALHLKCAVTAIDDETLLIDRSHVDAAAFDGFDIVDTAVGEGDGANVLRVNDTLFAQRAFSKTFEKLERHRARRGLSSVRGLDMGELRKAEGALTCCSLLLRR